MKKVLIGLLALGSISSFADTENYLRITAYTDLSAKNCQSLEVPEVFNVDVDFVNKTRCLEFYAFLDSDMIESICFVGQPSHALDTIDAILAVTTGDAWVTPAATAKVTKSLVSRRFEVSGEGGESWEVASVPACK